MPASDDPSTEETTLDLHMSVTSRDLNVLSVI